jgi:hypothetical protein
MTLNFFLSLAFLLVGIVAGGYLTRLLIFRIKDRMRAINLIFLEVLIPKKDTQQDKESEGEQFGSGKDYTKMIGMMSQFFSSMQSLRASGIAEKIFRSDYFTCEYSVIDGEVLFHLGVPRNVRELIEKQITSYYPDAVIEETPAPNIFTRGNETSCCYFQLAKKSYLPIRTIDRLESDSLNNITNVLSKIRHGEGAAIQFVCRPIPDDWQEKSMEVASGIYNSKENSSFLKAINPFVFLRNLLSLLFHGPSEDSPQKNDQITPLAQERVKAIEEKASKSGFDVVVRLVTAAQTKREASGQLANLRGAFEQFNDPNMNGFSKTTRHSQKKLMRDYIYRRFSRGKIMALLHYRKNKQWRQILNADEMACLYHFPNSLYNKSPSIKWQDFKISPAPHNLPKEGLLLGYNVHRGEKREVRIKRDDRRRHFYAIGKSGTGKSTILEYMIRQDVQNGEGVCVVDPHGDLVEAILPYIPRSRADDVILFDPGDLARPMGLNLLEAKTEELREFVAQETLAIFIKLYGEEIMGPRLQHYFRNGVLTLLADEKEGATLIDIMRLFTDINYEKLKKKNVTNPSVRSFWDREMAKTGQREKEEIIPYFASKFGPFVTNAQVRNIFGTDQKRIRFSRRDGQSKNPSRKSLERKTGRPQQQTPRYDHGLKDPNGSDEPRRHSGKRTKRLLSVCRRIPEFCDGFLCQHPLGSAKISTKPYCGASVYFADHAK